MKHKSFTWVDEVVEQFSEEQMKHLFKFMKPIKGIPSIHTKKHKSYFVRLNEKDVAFIEKEK